MHRQTAPSLLILTTLLNNALKGGALSDAAGQLNLFVHVYCMNGCHTFIQWGGGSGASHPQCRTVLLPVHCATSRKKVALELFDTASRLACECSMIWWWWPLGFPPPPPRMTWYPQCRSVHCFLFIAWNERLLFMKKTFAPHILFCFYFFFNSPEKSGYVLGNKKNQNGGGS